MTKKYAFDKNDHPVEVDPKVRKAGRVRSSVSSRLRETKPLRLSSPEISEAVEQAFNEYCKKYPSDTKVNIRKFGRLCIALSRKEVLEAVEKSIDYVNYYGIGMKVSKWQAIKKKFKEAGK